MGVVPEPARGADDVSRLVPCETFAAERTARARTGSRPSNTGRRGRTVRRSVALAAVLLAGLSLPQTAFAPAASAHDRIDIGARAAQVLAERLAELPAAEAPAEAWAGVPLPEQEPSTAELIADDLAALPQPARDADADLIRFGSVSVPRRIVHTILRASDEAGVDPVYMMALADKESSFDPAVKAATSSAQGLFQFVTATWLEMIRDYGARYGFAAEAAAVKGRGGAISVADEGMRRRVLALRSDPYVASLMAAELIKRDRGRIEARVGRSLTTTELYFAHFLGTSSAGRFLVLTSDAPDHSAQKAFRSAARANRSLFTAKTGKGRRGLTVAEVYERIDGMIDRRLSRYEGVAALAPADERAAPVVPAAAGRIQITEALPTGL